MAQALEVDPTNKTIVEHIDDIDRELAKAASIKKNMYSKMF